MTTAIPAEAIELRVDTIAQLFHSLDPFPFRERDLDREAEEYIVNWACELASNQPITIIVPIPDSEAQTKAAQELGEAFARYLAYRADLLQRDLNELFRVGVTISIACLVATHVVSGYLVEFPFRRLVEESFLILGWGCELEAPRNFSL